MTATDRKLKREELGSECCNATLIDPGNTGEGMCSDCKEHSEPAIACEVSVMVLTTNGEAHHHILDYDGGNKNDLDDRVESMVDKLYNINQCRFAYSTDKVLTFTEYAGK